MANEEHLKVLKQGVERWNQWLKEVGTLRPDLSQADLRAAHLFRAKLGGATLWGASLVEACLVEADLSAATLFDADLSGADLSRSDLAGANLFRANLSRANLNRAHLRNADLSEADLSGADLSEADLSEADLRGATLNKAFLTRAFLDEANLSGANFSEADLSEADLEGAILVQANLTRTVLTNCRIYGIAAWNVKLEGASQHDLIITPQKEPTITVDNLKVAQFIYLLLSNVEIREVIDTITSKVVLILGRFTRKRKAVLDALREALRRHNYSPILFDFEKPVSRDLTETVSTLAHLARFIIVDLTDPSSAPHEVATVIPQTVVPVLPLLLQEPLLLDGTVVERREYAMFQDLRRRYDWVLPTYHYADLNHLLATLKAQVIDPAEQKAQELAKR